MEELAYIASNIVG